VTLDYIPAVTPQTLSIVAPIWNARLMKRFFTALTLSATFALSSYAQQSSSPRAGDMVTITNADQATYYVTLNQRVLELKTQSELLTQLAQEHKRRSKEIAADQQAKSQWESDLGMEMAAKAAAMMPLLTKATQDRLAFEQAHPDLVVLRNFQPAPADELNPDAVAFLGKLEERLGLVRQELAQAIESGKLYAAYLVTNTSPLYLTDIPSQLQANGDEVKRLQREVFDLELRRLEFHALRRE
jgi:hypothetical protein